jgi:hypothetical protein
MRKFKQGSTTTRSAITVFALVAFLLYVTSVGVSASNSTGSLNSPATLGHTTTVYRTKTITKTITKATTSTVFVDSTTTATSTVTDTSTSTVTSTTTTASVSTVTVTPNILSGDGKSGFQQSEYVVTPFSNSVDCSVTVSLATQGFGGDGVITTLSVDWKNAEGDQFGVVATNSVDVSGYSNTFSAASVTLAMIFSSAPAGSLGASFSYSWTATCPT